MVTQLKTRQSSKTGPMHKLLRLLQRRKGTDKLQVDTDNLAIDFFGGNDENTVSPSSSAYTSPTVSPFSSVQDLSDDEFVDLLPDVVDHDCKTPWGCFHESFPSSVDTPLSHDTGFSNIYSLIDDMVQEQQHVNDVASLAEKSVRTRKSTVSTSVFSTASTFCIFDDGSVTVGEKPFQFVHGKNVVTSGKDVPCTVSTKKTKARSKQKKNRPSVVPFDEGEEDLWCNDNKETEEADDIVEAPVVKITKFVPKVGLNISFEDEMTSPMHHIRSKSNRKSSHHSQQKQHPIQYLQYEC